MKNSLSTFELDYIKADRRARRETYGFEPTRIRQSKKAYRRSVNKLTISNYQDYEY